MNNRPATISLRPLLAMRRAVKPVDASRPMRAKGKPRPAESYRAARRNQFRRAWTDRQRSGWRDRGV